MNEMVEMREIPFTITLSPLLVKNFCSPSSHLDFRLFWAHRNDSIQLVAEIDAWTLCFPYVSFVFLPLTQQGKMRIMLLASVVDPDC